MDLFGTAGIRGPVRETVTPELALAVGRAAGSEGAEFVVGRDGRETGPALVAALEAGLESAGADVRRAGVLPTPALARASRGRHGVMVTASHNPPADNGIKLFVDGQEYDHEAEQAVVSRVKADDPPVSWDAWGDGEHVETLPDYRRAVVEYAREHGAPLDGLRVAVDCGNGVGALATPQVLRVLGAHVVALNANVDGHFPGRGSKPTPESLADLRAFVRGAGDEDEEDFALGIGHDGDADRIVVVDDEGEVVHEDTVLAILAEYYVAESDDDDPVVVTTPNASARIDERVASAGGQTERVNLGSLHEGVTDVEGTVVFAAEPWKHIHPGLGPWIDGVASAAVFARLVARTGLADLREPVNERPYRKENVKCPDDRKARTIDRLEASLPDAFPDATVSTKYGVRLDWDGEWVLVRPSGTEPYVRIYAEHEDVDGLVRRVVETVEEAVEEAG